MLLGFVGLVITGPAGETLQVAVPSVIVLPARVKSVAQIVASGPAFGTDGGEVTTICVDANTGAQRFVVLTVQVTVYVVPAAKSDTVVFGAVPFVKTGPGGTTLH